MRKIKIILCFLLCLICLSACKPKTNYYFRIIDNRVDLEVGDSINISSLNFITNLPTIEHMYISDNYNKEIVKVDNLVITALEEGELSLYVCIKYNNKVYKVEIDIRIKDVVVDKESKIFYNIDKYIEGNYCIYLLTFYKEHIGYSNFNYEFINYNENNLLFINKYSYILEIGYDKDYDFSLKIIDLVSNEFVIFSSN